MMLAKLFHSIGFYAPASFVGTMCMKIAGRLDGKAVLYYAILATDHKGTPFWWDLPGMEPREAPSDFDLEGRLSHLPPNRFFGVKLIYYPCPFASRSWMEFELVESFAHPLSVKDWETIVIFRFPSLFRASRLTGKEPDLYQLRQLGGFASEAQRLAGRFVCYIFGKSEMPDLDACFSHWGPEDIYAALVAAGPRKGPGLMAGRILPETLQKRVEKCWAATVC